MTKPRFEFATAPGETKQTAVYGLAITPDGKRVITSNANGATQIWDVVSGKLQGIIAGQQDGKCQLAVSPDGQSVAVGDRENRITIALDHRADPSQGEICRQVDL